MDDHRKALHQSMGWMASIKCPCCNPTLTRWKHHHSVTIYNKKARTKLKRETMWLLKENQ